MRSSDWSHGSTLAAMALGCVAVLASIAGGAAVRTTPEASPSERFDARTLAFEPNRGQTDPNVRFIARGSEYTAFLTATEAVIVPRGRSDAEARDTTVVRMKLVGANPSSSASASDELPGKVSYVPATGPEARLSGIQTYATVRYTAVYPGIDLVWYDNGGRLEYDFVVNPAADPGVISLRFEGAHSMDVDDVGALVLRTTAGEIRQLAPTIYQERRGERERVDGHWVRTGSQSVGIKLGSYDRTRPLVIDPLISYSSYLGGSGHDWAYDIALDTAGNIFVAGGTNSPNFPGAAPRATTANAAFVTKLSAGGQLLYSTYLLDTDDRGATGIAVDPMGNAYVTGRTSLYRATASNDVFVAKLDPFGRVLRPSGYFITFGGDRIDWANRIAVDAAGQAFVTGTTQGGSFPTTPGAFRRFPAGETDVFVTKLNAAGTAFIYSTLIGGSGDDSANDIAQDFAGNVYITGSTESINFPVTAAGFQRTHRGCYTAGYVNCAPSAFVTKLNPWGTGLVYSTYLGGSGIDQESSAEGIAVDAAGNAYVVGSTTADNFPVTAGVIQPKADFPLCYYEVCMHPFVTKLNPSGSALVYSTYLRGEAQDFANAVAVDAAGNAYVAGGTSSRYFPILHAFQPKAGSHRDAFVAKLNANASALVYSSYLGGAETANGFAGSSAAMAIAVDPNGRAHVTGVTYASNFPTTFGAVQRVSGGCNSFYGCGDGFVTRIAATGAGAPQATSVSMTSARAVTGQYISATWSGMPAPSAWDTVHVYPLGDSSEPYEVWGGWYTTGAANGTVWLLLPPELATGWYELRLSSFNDLYGRPIARSAPFQVFRW